MILFCQCILPLIIGFDTAGSSNPGKRHLPSILTCELALLLAVAFAQRPIIPFSDNAFPGFFASYTPRSPSIVVNVFRIESLYVSCIYAFFATVGLGEVW